MVSPNGRDWHFVVCMKVVPKPEEVRVDPETRRLDRAGARSEINPPDMNALEMALQLKDRFGGRVSIVSMGPPFFEPYLRVGLAMGADHIYLLSDRRFGGADTLATTYTLARGIEKLGPVDLVFCGRSRRMGPPARCRPGWPSGWASIRSPWSRRSSWIPGGGWCGGVGSGPAGMRSWRSPSRR
jgi:electron transfer flavoprotein beta subunit